jgi:hypothetical protein
VRKSESFIALKSPVSSWWRQKGWNGTIRQALEHRRREAVLAPDHGARLVHEVEHCEQVPVP